MSDNSKKPKKRHSVGKWFLAGGLVIILLLGGGVLYIYSPWFFVHWVLPVLTDPASIKVEYQSLSGGYFSPVKVHQADFYLEEGEPFLTTEVLASDYNPWGAIFTQTSYAFVFRNAHLQVRQKAEGGSNIDPIFEAIQKEDNQGQSNQESGGGFRLSLLGIENSRITLTQETGEGAARSLQLLDLGFSLTNWVPDQTALMQWQSEINVQPADQVPIDQLQGSGKGEAEFVLNEQQNIVRNETHGVVSLARNGRELSAEIRFQKERGEVAEGSVSLALAGETATIAAAGLPLGTNHMTLTIRGFDERFIDFVFPQSLPTLEQMELTGEAEVWNAEAGWQIEAQATASGLALQGWDEPDQLTATMDASLDANGVTLSSLTLGTGETEQAVSLSGEAHFPWNFSRFTLDGSTMVDADAISKYIRNASFSSGEVRFQGEFTHASPTTLPGGASFQRIDGTLSLEDISGRVTGYLVTNLTLNAGLQGRHTNQSVRLTMNFAPDVPPVRDLTLNATWQSLRPLSTSVNLDSSGFDAGKLVRFFNEHFSSLQEDEQPPSLPLDVDRFSLEASLGSVAYDMPGAAMGDLVFTNTDLWITTSQNGRVFAIRGQAGVNTAGDGSGATAGTWTMDSTIRFSEEGTLQVANLGSTINFDNVPWSARTNLVAEANLEYIPNEVPRASLAVTDPRETLLDIRTVGLPLRTNAVEVRIAQAQSELVNAFVDLDAPSWLLPFRLQGRAELTSIKELPIQVDARFTIEQAAQQETEELNQPRAARLTLLGTILEDRLHLRYFRAEEQSAVPLFVSEGQLNLSWDFSNFTYDGSTRIHLPELPGGQTRNGELAFIGHFQHRDNAGDAGDLVQHFKGELRLHNLSGDYQDFSVTNLTLRLETDAARTNQTAQAKLTLRPQSPSPQNLELEASWNSLDPVQANIRLNAERLNLDPLHAIITNHITFGDGQEEPSTGWKMDRFPVDRLEFRANVQDLALGEMQVDNWTARGVMREQSLSVNEFSLTMQGGAVEGQFTLNPRADQRPAYDLSLEARQLPLAPIPHTFMPDVKGIRSADLTMELQAEGAGFTKEAMVETLSGSVDLRMDNINMDVADQMAQSWFAPLAGIFVADEFLSPHIRRAYLTAQVSDGTLDITDLIIAGEGFIMMAEPDIPLNVPLTESPIQSEDVAVFASLSTAREMNVVVGDPPARATHIKLPNFMELQGTLGNPQVNVQGTDFAGSLFEQYTEQIFGGEMEQYLSRPKDVFVTRH